jgi:hypothetical protein
MRGRWIIFAEITSDKKSHATVSYRTSNAPVKIKELKFLNSAVLKNPASYAPS